MPLRALNSKIAPEGGDALIIVGVVLQHATQAVGVADHEQTGPRE